MKKRLVILSDLWGFKNADWLDLYTQKLEEKYDIHCYDSRELGEIQADFANEKAVHTEFLLTGIKKAVENLFKKETTAFYILGFSVGGTIAWKAATSNFQIKYLCPVSATRLRYEGSRPKGIFIDLFYGEEDPYRPNDDWFDFIGAKGDLIPKGKHEIYKNEAVATTICNRIIENSEKRKAPFSKKK